MTTCKNCDSTTTGKYCSNCGQSSRIHKVNYKSVLQEIPNSIFQVDKGFFYTVKELFTHPGLSIREYLEGKRIAHYKPISFVLLLATLYVLSSLVVDQDTVMGEAISGFSNAFKDSMERGNASFLETNAMPSIIAFLDWFKNNYAYATLILLPFGALTTFISFYGKGYNYFEHLVINLYVEGQKLIVYLLFVPILYVTSNETLEYYIEGAMFVIPIFFAAWTFVQVFNTDKKVSVVLRLILSYLLYYILFNVITVGGTIIIAGIYYLK